MLKRSKGYSAVIRALLVISACLLQAAATAAEPASADPAARRAAALEIARQRPADAVQLLADMLKDENAVVRRTAARGLRELGKPAAQALAGALNHTDPEVRMAAFMGLNDLGALTLDNLAVAIKDKDNVAIRQSAAEILARMPPSPETRALLEQAGKDDSQQIREIVAKALYPFPFYRKTESIRDRADNIIRVTQTIPLPLDGWRLKFDPGQNGHVAKWFDPGLKDGDWEPVSIGKYWDDFGHKAQTGIGWYRGRFKLPDKPVCNAVEICFDAVDESAWVWINGEYVGQHDIGPNGWTVPFRLDATAFLKWGQENQITVRVLNTAAAGGIWKPVTLEVLKLGN